MSKDLILLRAKMLGEMDKYILDTIGDEEITHIWETYGVPDGATEEDILLLAEEEESWLDCIGCFANCCRAAGVIK